jgi:predicted AlkP superfamily pyrophosphatase or phosphodiesterase
VEGLKARRLFDRTNLIVVSDHGMAATSTKRVIFIDDFADVELFHVIMNGPLVSIYPNEKEDFRSIHLSLSRGSKDFGHFSVWTKDELPSSLHYQNDRVGPIIILADVVLFLR